MSGNQNTQGQRVVVSEWGESPLDALDNHMTLTPMPTPDASELGDKDVLLRVRCCAVGWVDLIMSSGQYQHMSPPPYTPGLEFAGDVVAVGSEVQSVAPGDRVLADGIETGPRSHSKYRDQGGFATWAIVPERAALPLSDKLSYAQAVNLLGNYETAYHVLIKRARLQPGEWVLINGASGATGLAALRIAKHVGARVIATGRSQAKLDILMTMGADAVVHTPDDEALAQLRHKAKEITGGTGAHVVYDGVGGKLVYPSLRSLRFGGRFCIVGWASTPNVSKGKGKRGAPNANMVPTNIVQMKGIDVLGCPAIISLKHHPEWRGERQKWIFDRIESGELAPDVGAEYRLVDYREAMLAKWRSEHVGGCHVVP